MLSYTIIDEVIRKPERNRIDISGFLKLDSRMVHEKHLLCFTHALNSQSSPVSMKKDTTLWGMCV